MKVNQRRMFSHIVIGSKKENRNRIITLSLKGVFRNSISVPLISAIDNRFTFCATRRDKPRNFNCLYFHAIEMARPILSRFLKILHQFYGFLFVDVENHIAAEGGCDLT